ncbi:hypothetical protein Tco_1424266 [Tanacetum coccineum]
MVVQAQEEMGEGLANPTDPHHTPTIIQPSTSQPQKTQKPRRPKRKDIEVPQPSGPTTNVADEAVNEEMDDSLVRAATTASNLEATQDSCNIYKTQSKATPNEPSSPGTSSGGGPRRQETIGDTIAQTRSENVSKLSNDPLLARVLALEKIKTTQANEIDSLKRRVKRLKKKDRKRTYKLKRLYKVGLTARVESSDDVGLGEEDASKQGRIADIDVNEDIYLVNVQTDEDMFGVNDLDGDEVIVDNVDAAEDIVVIEKAKLVSVAEEIVNVAATTVSTASIILVKAQDKGKGIMVEESMVEQVKPIKRLEQMRLDEELAFKLQAEEEEEEEERLAREKAKQLALRLQAQEQEELTDAEKARLFVQFLEQRRKYFTAKRVEEKRNRPPTRAQQRSIMCTYLKNMEGWKPKDLKNRSFANIQELFDKAMKRVNTFVDYRTEVVEESSKKANAEIA